MCSFLMDRDKNSLHGNYKRTQQETTKTCTIKGQFLCRAQGSNSDQTQQKFHNC